TNTGTIASLALYNFVVEVTVTSTTIGFIDVATITATSVANPTTSDASTINTYTGDFIAPGVATNVACVLNANNEVVITWTNPTTNSDGTPMYDLASLKVYRGVVSGTYTTLLGTLNAPGQTFTDTTPLNGANFYAIKAVDLSGNEGAFSSSSQCNVVATSGGPDTFGHTWVSSLNGAIPYSFPNIATTGTAFGVYGDDSSGPFTLPWPFPFYGATYSTGLVGTNGYITFGSTGNAYSNTAIPTTLEPNNSVFAFWDDLIVTQGTSEIYYLNDVPNNRFIFQWNNVPHLSTTAPYTFQIILYPDGTIGLNYEAMTGNLLNCTVGIEDATATDGLQVVFNGIFLQSNLSLLITTEDNFPPQITNTTQVVDSDVHNQNFPVWLRATDMLSGVQADSVELFWKLSSNTTWNNVPMTPTANDSFFAEIPAPNTFDVVMEYFFSATDADTGENTAYFPYNPTNGTGTPYSFEVRLLTPGTLSGESLFPGYIPLAWGQPGENGIQLKYDDGTSEFQTIIPNSPPGLNSPGPSSFANKFNIATQTQIVGPAQMNSVKIYIADSALVASTYKVKIYDADGTTGLPNNVIWESATLDQTGAAGTFVNFDLTNPVTGAGLPIGSGVFFVGVEQVGTDKISLGGDTTLNPPYLFYPNTHYIAGTGGGWAPIETLAPVYGTIIPMIRCFVEPVVVGPAPVISAKANKIAQVSKNSNAKASFSKDKKQNTISLAKGGNQINLNPSWTIIEYKLYKMNGAAATSAEVLTNGSLLYNGLTQTYDDYNVTSPNQYSYAATVVYDVAGTNMESHPGNLIVATPGISPGSPDIFANTVDFDSILVNLPSMANLVVKNTGNALLTVSGMTFGATNPLNAQFSNPPNLPFSLQGGDSTIIEITVFPTTLGALTSTLEIANNTTTNPNYVVDLIATVVLEATENQNEIPKTYSLKKNYPNPFNPTTTIEFGIPEKSLAKLVVYNVLGQKVKTLVSKELTPAFYKFQWNGTDEANKQVSSGIYFYRLETSKFVKTEKMVLLK
ncbi:T9SS type A sorting domain-containing protein, partial [bacterium]|nr:T9SS type A sorting domain-containing protein [bacterium]